MKGILDTHTFIWWDSDPTKLSPAANLFLKDPANFLLLSVASVWEIIIKVQVGKLAVRMPLPGMLAQQQSNGLVILPIKVDHALAVESLPLVHKDPFDRLLIAQAQVENAVVLTNDAVFSHYSVQVVW
jgi:PIN domain nuclease of toxin-antitoxin system